MLMLLNVSLISLKPPMLTLLPSDPAEAWRRLARRFFFMPDVCAFVCPDVINFLALFQVFFFGGLVPLLMSDKSLVLPLVSGLRLCLNCSVDFF